MDKKTLTALAELINSKTCLCIPFVMDWLNKYKPSVFQVADFAVKNGNCALTMKIFYNQPL
jgi:hypothetical protein